MTTPATSSPTTTGNSDGLAAESSGPSNPTQTISARMPKLTDGAYGHRPRGGRSNSLRDLQTALSRACSDERVRRRLVGIATLLAVGAAALVLAELSAGRAALAGTISYSSFRSKSLGGVDHYSIYLPADYDMGATRYPVVYFLHGLPASATAYRSIQPVVQALEQTRREAIVVGVQGARNGDTDPEWLDWVRAGTGRRRRRRSS